MLQFIVAVPSVGGWDRVAYLLFLSPAIKNYPPNEGYQFDVRKAPISQGHRSLAGRRSVGGVRTRAQGPMRGCPLGSCRGFYGVLGQWGIHLAHPLINLEGERVPPPTERQMHDTGIRDRPTPGNPPLAYEIVHHLTQCRQPQA